MGKLKEKTILPFGKKNGEKKILALSPLVDAKADVEKDLGRGHLLEAMHNTLSQAPVHYEGEVFACNVMSGYKRSGLYPGGNAVQISVDASIKAADISMMLFGQPGREYVVYDHTECKWYKDGKEWDRPVDAKPVSPATGPS